MTDRKRIANRRLVKELRPDHSKSCPNCSQSPVVPMSGLCGPCHFGTADAVHGGWWNESADDLDAAFVEDHL